MVATTKADSSLPELAKKYIMAVVKGLIASHQPWAHTFGTVQYSSLYLEACQLILCQPYTAIPGEILLWR